VRAVSLVLLSLLIAVGCSGSSRRQPPPWMRPAEKPRDENFRGGPSAMLTKYDANKDGTVTRDELIAGLRAEFAAHDVKRNGCLDDDQVGDINQSRVDSDQSTASPLIDWNQDDCINYTEFSAAPYSLFDQMDRNRDGKVTPQEMGRKPASRDAAEPGEQEQRDPQDPSPGQ
jgi:Ca2+-binding EF-hand superfamily protein